MSDVSQSAKPVYRDMFTGFGAVDWLFVVLLYVAVVYLVLQIILQFFGGAYSFDFMPIVNGTLFIFVAWDCVRLRRRMQGIFDALDQSGAITFKSPQARQDVLDAIYRLDRQYGAAMAAVVLITMVVNILYYFDFFAGDRPDFANFQIVDPGGKRVRSLFEPIALLVVAGIAAILAGYFLGAMIANGRLLDVLRGFKYELSGFNSDSGVRTLQLIEAIYAFAARVTLSLCAVLAAWWVVFRLQLPFAQEYAQWEIPFLGLWFIALVSFVMAVLVPVRAFQSRLDEVYGGAEAHELVRSQLATARLDLATLDKQLAGATPADRERLQRHRDDLSRFVDTLDNRVFRKPLLRTTVLGGLLAANIAIFLIFLVLPGGTTSAGGPPKQQQQQQQQQQQRQQQQQQQQQTPIAPPAKKG